MVTQTTIQPAKPIPSIKELPIIGSIPAYNKDRLEVFTRVVRECGDVGMFHFGPFPIIMFNSPKFVHSILVEHTYDFDKGVTMHNAFEPLIGKGLFISEGAFHRQQRKLMAPSFQPKQIQSYADTMVQYGKRLQETWQDEEVVDIGREMTHVTMSIVGKVLFDADVFTEADELGAAMTALLERANYALSHLFPIPLSWPTSRNKRVKRAIALLRKRLQQMIDERRASNEEKNDFLSILLNTRGEDGSRMSDQQVMDEAVTLFGAGHETTATALTWAWYLLTQNPDVYSRLQQEVDTVLQGRSPTYADLTNLPYALQVFKETMRLYPPAYAISRVALHDIDLDGYYVRKNQTVGVCSYTMHRRPDYFPDPERFDPERFTPENEKRLPRYAYFPFGAGPRICIGNHFAMMEGHLLLATLAQRVTFELVPGQRIVPDPNKTITLRPKYAMKMVVRRRIG